MRSALVLALLAAALGCGGGGLGSIGAALRSEKETGALVVRSVPEGLAAAEAGLEEGDVIKMIDGRLVDGLKKEKLLALLRGEIGTTVELTVLRGERVLRIEVTRQAVAEPAPRPVAPRAQPEPEPEE